MIWRVEPTFFFEIIYRFDFFEKMSQIFEHSFEYDSKNLTLCWYDSKNWIKKKNDSKNWF